MQFVGRRRQRVPFDRIRDAYAPDIPSRRYQRRFSRRDASGAFVSGGESFEQFRAYQRSRRLHARYRRVWVSRAQRNMGRILQYGRGRYRSFPSLRGSSSMPRQATYRHPMNDLPLGVRDNIMSYM